MSRPLQSTASKVSLGIVVVVVVLVFVGWRVMQPKIRTATMAEIRAVLPKDLLETTSVDVPAQLRFRKLRQIVQSIDPKTIIAMSAIGTSGRMRAAPIDHYVAAQQFWRDHPQLLNDLEALIDAGPIQTSTSNAEFDMFTHVKTVSKALTISAGLYAANRQFAPATRMLRLSIKLGDELLEGGGPLINYLVAVSMQAITFKGIEDTVNDPNFPVSNCQELLAALSPAPKTDRLLGPAFRTDFQQYTLGLLPDPTKRIKDLIGAVDDTIHDDAGREKQAESIYGTYDAIETATKVGQCLDIALKNSVRPLSEMDKSAQAIVDAAEKDLPQEVDSSKSEDESKALDKLKYRVQMNTVHNSLGRLIIVNGLMTGQGLLQASCRWRALRDATRVLLASRIYRASHGNSLPVNINGFSSILGPWPQDPFNGKSLLYSASKQVVYSVGSNLIDDGGNVTNKVSQPRDVGVSLKPGD